MPVYQKDRPRVGRTPTSGMMRGAKLHKHTDTTVETQQQTAKPTLAYSPEIPRRAYDLPSAPRARTGGAPTPKASEHHRKLIVGNGISVSGKLTDCEHLIVQGHVEIDLPECKHIEIVKGGTFRGSATVDEASIGGRFDGDLNVKGMLRVRGTGVVTGTVHYGELIVEAGGQLKGTSEPTENSGTAHRPSD